MTTLFLTVDFLSRSPAVTDDVLFSLSSGLILVSTGLGDFTCIEDVKSSLRVRELSFSFTELEEF